MKELTILKNTYNIGLREPVRFLHMTDTHIVRDRKRENGRAAVFHATDEQIESYCFQALAYAKENNIPIIHTGDLIDYITEDNFKFLHKYFDEVDYLFAPGSHEYFPLIPGGEEHLALRAAGFIEDEAFKSGQIGIIAPHFKNNLYFASKTIGEVNFVVLDNCYSHITAGQLEALKAEASKGLPIVLGMHNPIDTEGLYTFPEVSPKERLCSSAEAQLAFAKKQGINDPEKYVFYFDEDTYSAVKYIKNEPLIRLVLCGHLHRNFEGPLSNSAIQVMTNGTCIGFVREITLV